MESKALFEEMQVDPQMQARLSTVAKWARFIAITGLVIGGLCIIALAAAGKAALDKISSSLKVSDASLGLQIGVMALYAGLFATWLVLMLNASSRLKQGLNNRNIDQLAEGMKSLKLVFTLSVAISGIGIIYTLYSMFA